MSAQELQSNYEELLDRLTYDFSPSEFEDLLFELGIPTGILEPGTQRERAQSLLRLIDASHRQSELYKQLREDRPDDQWPRHFLLPTSQTAAVYMNLPDAGRLSELTALTVRSAPYLLTRIGREAEYRALVATLQETVRTRHGRTVCLLGHTGCGRRALMADVQKSALSLGYRLATIRFEDLEEAQPSHVRVQWGDLTGRPARQFVAETFPRTAKETGGEWADLMRQLADEGTFAYVGRSSASDDPRALKKLIRAAGNRDPLLVCVENLDAAQNLWIDLLHDLALHEIPRDLPVVLLIGMDAPQPLADLRGPRHSERTRLAQKLVRDGVATAYFLGPITTADIRAWVGPAASELTERLAHLSDFDPKVVETLWLEWKARGVAVQETGGRWVVAAGARQWVAGNIRDHALALLSAALEGYEDDIPYTAEQVEHILACAALEGEVFHVEAVARALELDADELMDFFDTYLTAGQPDDAFEEVEDGVEEGEEEVVAADAFAPEPLLEEAGFHKMALKVYVDGQPKARYLHLYRFARPYLHLVWERYGPPEAKRKAWPLALANALEVLYDPFATSIAGKLIRLFKAAGADSRAAQYERRHTGRLTLEQLRWHLDALLAEPTEDKYALSRLFEAAIPFLGRWAEEQPGEWAVGLRYALQVGARAEALDDEENAAEAWYYAAWMHYNGASYAEGTRLARRALTIRESVAGKNHLDAAASLSILGLLLKAQGDLAGARPLFERALAIWERVLGPEHPSTATSVNNLAGLLRAQGDLAGARPLYERALAISERVLGPEHPDTAGSLNNLALLLQDQGDLAGARPLYERALAISERVLGPEHPNTAISYVNVGALLAELGEKERARALLQRAAAVFLAKLGPDHPYTRIAQGHLAGLD